MNLVYLALTFCTCVATLETENELDMTAREVMEKFKDHAQEQYGENDNTLRLQGRLPIWERVFIKIPPDWASDDIADSHVQCGSAYAIDTKGYIKFWLDSESEECSLEFLGSRKHTCTVAFLCAGTVELEPPDNSGCENEYLTVSDGTTGLMQVCGAFSFDGTPRIPDNGGTDLYIRYKGQSLESPCIAFCIEDLDESHYDIDEPIPIDKNEDFNGLQTSESCVCGIRNDRGRVIGGINAMKFEFPWLGGLVIKHRTFHRIPLCGATLISDMHVLTAAHCFKQFGNDPEKYQIILHFHVTDKMPSDGSWNDSDVDWIPGWDLPTETDESEGTVRVNIAEIIFHPLFSVPGKFAYDIAILKLAEPVDFESSMVSPICLQNTDEVHSYENRDPMFVAGWGAVHATDQPANTRIPRKVEVPYVSEANCWHFLRRHHSLLCAGYLAGRKDSCRGDSGGPLMYEFNEDESQYLISGVVSTGDGCAQAYKPGLYTDLQEVVQWIYYHTARDEDALWCTR